MGRRIQIEHVSSVCVLVRGHGSRELLTEVRRGRAPVWGTRDHAWIVQADTAADAQALAESRGYDVAVVGDPTPVAWRSGPTRLAEGPTAVDATEDPLW